MREEREHDGEMVGEQVPFALLSEWRRGGGKQERKGRRVYIRGD